MLRIPIILLFTFTFTQSLFISEYSEGSSYNKYVEIYNPTDNSVDLSSYQLWKISNGGDWEEGAGNGLDLSGSLASNDVYVICHTTSSVDSFITNAADIAWTQASFNGDDALALVKDVLKNTFLIIS